MTGAFAYEIETRLPIGGRIRSSAAAGNHRDGCVIVTHSPPPRKNTIESRQRRFIISPRIRNTSVDQRLGRFRFAPVVFSPVFSLPLFSFFLSVV